MVYTLVCFYISALQDDDIQLDVLITFIEVIFHHIGYSLTQWLYLYKYHRSFINIWLFPELLNECQSNEFTQNSKGVTRNDNKFWTVSTKVVLPSLRGSARTAALMCSFALLQGPEFLDHIVSLYESIKRSILLPEWCYTSLVPMVCMFIYLFIYVLMRTDVLFPWQQNAA